MFTVTAKLPGENNRDYSYRVIKEAIMALELKPGQTISEIELAEALQLSRTPIREVLAKLREEHLVEVIPQVGTYVSKIKPKLIEEATFVRITLEKEILKLSCESFPKEKLLQLKGNVAQQELLIGQQGMERKFHQLDKDFHYIIFSGNNKENAWDAINRLSTHYNRMRLLSEMEHSFNEAINQHKMFIEIIENHQAEKVEGIIRQHIIEPIKLWEDLYKENSPYKDFFDHTYKMPVF
ncbi:GntR family transcriptional regulator [Neobacillus dielmonensis]|uniref:GntR family transcriptional regulator n=1 Tax=Neobacillus dielmonensis TaxID=1347369 RepID=UPI0005A67F31|nr:GntR family transcriptional regulator [Neobacillus dielmonensis]